MRNPLDERESPRLKRPQPPLKPLDGAPVGSAPSDSPKASWAGSAAPKSAAPPEPAKTTTRVQFRISPATHDKLKNVAAARHTAGELTLFNQQGILQTAFESFFAGVESRDRIPMTQIRAYKAPSPRSSQLSVVVDVQTAAAMSLVPDRRKGEIFDRIVQWQMKKLETA